MSLSLIDGEKIFEKTCPHFFSMIHLYINWFYIGMIGFLTIFFRNDITLWIQSLPFLDKLENFVFLGFWALALIIPACIVSFIRINWGWLLLAIFLSVVGICAHIWQKEILSYSLAFAQEQKICHIINDFLQQNVFFYESFKQKLTISEISNYWLIFISFIGLFSANSYRRSHRYYITNRRIITRFGFWITRERDLLYSKIDDLVAHQSFLGKILGFGTLIPISASGIGTGSDQAIWMAGAEQKLPVGPSLKITMGGGRTVTVPRAPSFYSLYGVPHPEWLRNIMLKEMEKREYGYTRRAAEKE